MALTALTGLLLIGCRTPPTTSKTDPPGPAAIGDRTWTNLLMISIDTLRLDHVDPWATDGVVRMPFLASILDQSVRYRDAEQCSNWTLHSTTCTLLGRPTEDIGWVARFGDVATPVPDGQTMLATRLASAGFLAEIASSNGYLSSDWNNIQGYEQDLSVGPTVATEVAAKGLDGTAARLQETGADRWFLHLHFVEPHVPYVPPDPYLVGEDQLPPIPWDLTTDEGTNKAIASYPSLSPADQDALEQHLRFRYDADLHWLDDQLRDLWDRLRSEGWLDDTAVALWTDHGEEFWEHGRANHAKDLFAEENDALVAFWADDLVPKVVDGPGHSLDIAPTSLALVGVPLPGDGSLPGYVIGSAPSNRARFSTSAGFESSAAVTRDGWKLVFEWTGALHLYHRAVDPTDSTDLYEKGDPKARELWTLLEPRAKALAALTPDVKVSWPDP